MKMQWVESNRAQERDGEKYLGEYRIAPEQDDLEAGCWYYNKVTGRCYVWSAVEEGKPHYDFSRTPNSGENYWNERGEKPPVHENIEWCGKRGGYWVKARVVDYTDEQICLLHHSDQSYKPHKMEVFNFSDIDLRPLKSERERAIEEMVAVIKSVPEYNDFGVAETLYDAGFRKEGK